MKKSRKVMRFIGFAVVFVFACFVMQGCSSKSSKKRDDIYSKLCAISDELSSISSHCDDAAYYSYSEMKDALKSIAMDCEDLRQTVEELSYEFEEKDDDYDGRRSWYY